MTEGALAGVRVADFSRVLAGPLVGMMLGDLGADVLKVEPPGGDETRRWGPPHAPDGTSTYFLGVNRNKRSIRLDLTDAGDRAVARRLLDRCDVVVENFRPGVMDRFGLGWEEVAAANPGLVYCSITGFGREGGALIPGYDAVVQAVGGLMSVTGFADGAPVKAGVAVVDVLAGLHGLVGVLAALHAPREGGRGQRVEVTLLGSLLAALSNHSSGYLGAGVVPARMGNAHPSIEPYATFPTGDGDVMICVGNDRQFRALCAVLGLGATADDPRFATNEARTAHRDLLRPLLVTALASAGREHWEQELHPVGVPCGRINGLDEAFAFADRLGLRPVDEHGGVRTVSSPIGLSRTPARTRLPPPGLDQHGARIRAWLDEHDVPDD